MKQRIGGFGVALVGGIGVALAALGLLTRTVPAVAAASVPMPFKATTATAADHFTIPLPTPLIETRITGSGQADLLGAFSVTGHHVIHADASNTGGTAAITDGVEVFATAAGDALFITYSGLIRPVAANGDITSEQAFTITGGQGRFVGATGGGAISIIVKNNSTVAGQILTTLTGVINLP